ncbi:hypothetical protein [Tateyamaria omphalii]|uniref:Uncharacterized protein n=1 Tax=Tateyamaria omphalii TaxID=299262 RepID=A0A1P8MQH6_9RHOB|nr:hypothetical protein [Tateyamaria omphalii]APX10282.1 hypothetical protein BWR18_00130 [Tateyamaria omphalii]
MSGRYMFVRRLHSGVEYEKVLNNNLAKLRLWNEAYPNHESWIRNVITGLKEDDYARIAYGAFVLLDDEDKQSISLAASMILTKKAFTPYLEIKNLSILDNELSKSIKDSPDYSRFREQCIEDLLLEAVRFAEARGYEKLVSEVFNNRQLNGEIISQMVRFGFSLDGSHARKHRLTDSTVYLSREVEQIYSLDPYDNMASAKWILTQVMPGFEKLEQTKVDFVCDDGTKFSGFGFTVSVRNFQTNPKAKFNRDEIIICVPEIASSRLTCNLSHINSDYDLRKISYVLDFQRSTNLLRSISQYLKAESVQAEYLDRAEIDRVLLGDALGRSARLSEEHLQLPYDQVNGMIVSSNPRRIEGRKTSSILSHGKYPVYIQLGPRGRYLFEEQYLVFTYTFDDELNPYEERGCRIWGIGRIERTYFVDIDQERMKLRGLGDQNSERYSDAEVLFENLEAVFEEGTHEIIWNKEQFSQHNNYNASNQAVGISLDQFYDLSGAGLSIPVESLKTTSIRKKLLAEDSAVYLSAVEVDSLLNLVTSEPVVPASGAGMEGLRSVILSKTPTLQYCHSSPSNRDKLFNNHSTLTEFFQSSFDFLEPVPVLSYNRLLTAMRVRSEISVLAAHITSSNVLELVSEEPDQRAVPIGIEEFVQAVGETGFAPKLSVLLCCNSTEYARKISEAGGFAVGFEGLLHETIPPTLIQRLLKDVQGKTVLSEFDLRTSLQGLSLEHVGKFNFNLFHEGQTLC